MPVTRSWQRTRIIAARRPGRRRTFRPPLLLAASVLVAIGVWQVYTAKTWTFAQSEERLAHGELLNLNSVTSADQLRPFLQIAPGREDELFSYLISHRPLRNVGALAKVHLFPVARLKPLFVVRTPHEFRVEFLRWIAIYFGAFWLVWLLWRVGGFKADPGILPALHLLTGFGFILMVSLRDPLRDTLEFSKFAWGAAAGCLLLLLPLFRFWDPGRISKWCYTPLFGAVGLTAMLLRFGYGPGGTDAKVNLGPFQPMELIKILLVLFLAGYFARHWERLRDLGRLANILPVLCAVAVALAMFFVLKDLGPALVVFFVFLAMFSVAHSRPWLAMLGIALMVGGVAVGYHLGKPPTVVGRINMWLSPWDNDVHGGDQLAHALWAFSTGGARGSGAGWGDPAMIPAGHTDLVMPAIGEEWGYAGVVAVALLFAFLVWRALRLALRARDEYSVLLSTGLAALIACEMLLITAGVTGALPLSGVASPFLSSGNTAMLANFLVFAIVLARPGKEASEPGKPFARPVRWVGAVLGGCALVLLGFAGYYQVLHDREYLARQTRVLAADGVKRAQRNPRINSIAHEVPRGSIVDRNGIPLATSDWNELERHRAEYAALSIDIDRACSRLDTRHYPFGALTMHLTGDLRTGENFHATNSSLVEHDSDVRLRGYRWEELPPLIRDRHRPGNPGVARLLARDRTVHMTIDVRLQQRAGEILARRLAAHKGALVVMDAQSGDVLAMASLPESDIDLARYGVYPPGSTFKLVTAMAALRLDPDMRRRTFLCRRLPDGRAGNMVRGWNRPVRDDVKDHPHGTLDMQRAITVSCNAYFAQLGVYGVGAEALADTARLLEIPAGDADTLRPMLPFAAYGQGPVLISPFKMARVAATIANTGEMPQGRWNSDESNARNDPPRRVLEQSSAAFLAGAMRRVVLEGTGRHAMAGESIAVAGKTGTAQTGQGEPHSWFAGFAPYDGPRRIAFAVVVEHGGYGALAAAPVAREIIDAAAELGIIQR